MPAKRGRGRPKKIVRSKNKEVTGVAKLRQTIQSVRWSDSYVSLLMGVIVVIIGVLFIVSVVKQSHHIQETSSTSTVATATVTPEISPSPALKPGEKVYTVKPGDDLWHIAEKYYSSGYNWVDIAKANNLSDPGQIYSGNTLIIPSVTPQVATVSPIPTTQVQNTITGTSYVVQKGDDLWHIAVRAYADGYQWVKIAKANNLSNPSLIFSGNVLQIPR